MDETKRISMKNYRRMRKHIKQFADDQANLQIGVFYFYFSYRIPKNGNHYLSI
jgi:hypothetical protein